MIIALQTHQSDFVQPSTPEQLEEQEKMGFLNRIKRGLEFFQDWFSDASDEQLITEYGFLKTFVEWD